MPAGYLRLGLALTLALPALAQKPLAWSSTTTIPSTPEVLADFNGDGKLDVIIRPAIQPAPPQLLFGNGDGTFNTGPAPVNAAAGFMAAGDLNGDGKPDLVACIPTSAAQFTLAILLNRGDGTFEQGTTLEKAACDGSLILVDLNHDGKLDIYDSGMYIWFGKGDGTFRGPTIYLNPEPFFQPGGLPLQPVIADFNGDGFLDLAEITYSDDPHQVSIFYNQGDGSFPPLPALVVNFSTPYGSTNTDSLAAGDFNGDGKADLAVLTPTGDLRVFLSNGDGTFRAGAESQFPAGTVGLYAIDVDGDGKLDLVYTTGRISVLRGHGDGTFGERIDLCSSGVLGVPFDLGGNNGALLFGDFNGDGVEDFVDYPSPGAFISPSTPASILLSGPSAPPVMNGGPLSAATFLAGPVSGGALVSIFGEGLTNTACQGLDAEITFNGYPAGILYAAPTQINAEVPWEVAGAQQAVVVAMRNGMPSQAVTVPVQAATPGIFTLSETGSGAGAIVPAGTHQLASPANPVIRGGSASIYGTGLGGVTHQPATGDTSPYAPMLAQTTATPIVTVGGVPAQVTFSGLSPSFVALYQVNIKVPEAAPSGDAVPVTVAVGNAVSNTVTVAVK